MTARATCCSGRDGSKSEGEASSNAEVSEATEEDMVTRL